MAWRDRLLAPLLGHSKASAERATRRYLDDINSTSCLNNLDKALDQLLDGIDEVETLFLSYATTNSSGDHVWNKDCFARYINISLPENSTAINCIPLLWGAWSAACYFPLSAPTGVPKQGSNPSNEPEINFKAFRRAYAFLVLRGYELFGTKSDGRPLAKSFDKSYTDKVPRLARIIFRSLSTISPQSATLYPQELLLQDFKDAIVFTQPIINENMHHGRAEVADEEFEAAARRLLRADDRHATVKGSSCAPSKADLQSLLQLLSLQRVEDRIWRNGLSYHDMYQRSGDVRLAQFAPSLDEEPQAHKYAFTFMAYKFSGGEDSVSWGTFKAWCSECPSFIFHFFQLWATLFAPTTEQRNPSDKSEFSLAISTTNTLCFLSVSHFISGKQPNYHTHQNEFQQHLDLRASTLVANLAKMPKLNVEELYGMVAARDWFHMLLIRGERTDAEGKSTSRLIVAFTSPPDKEMWRPEGTRMVQYVWRTSVIQLEPRIAVANGGGMSVSVEAESLRFQSHGATVKKNMSMKLDLAGKEVEIEGLKSEVADGVESGSAQGLGDGASAVRMRLTGLECYRLPGESSKITRSGESGTKSR